jgi:hypothetical protein
LAPDNSYCKICPRCQETKLAITEFNVDRSKPDGRYYICKKCLSTLIKLRRPQINAAIRLRYAKDPGPFKRRNKKSRAKHRDKRNEHMCEYRRVNVDYIKQKRQEWYSRGGKQYFRDYRRSRRAIDLQFRLACNLRTRLYCAIKAQFGQGQKGGSAVRDLGMSIKNFKQYVVSAFYLDPTGQNRIMSWENYGKEWHIDHIIPLSAFDLTDPQQVKVACHYTNLQPLWAEDNLRKGGRRS